MLSKNKIKLIHALELKKNRKSEKVFLAEGHKLVNDLLPFFSCRTLLATEEWLMLHPDVTASEIIAVSREELTRASLQKTPQDVLAIFGQPEYEFCPEQAAGELCLALDGVQDPGNLGTILRIADWFGIRHVFCSSDTADVYNPKAVQATMGALARVKTHYCDLPELVTPLCSEGVPVYGTFLDGENMYGEELSSHGLIIMGNEGNGISRQVAEHVNRRIFIPNYPKGETTSESLNVAVATAIVCAEFRRRG